MPTATLTNVTVAAAVTSPNIPAAVQGQPDNIAEVQVSGTFAGVTAAFEGTYTAVPTVDGDWFNIAAIRQDTLGIEQVPTVTDSTARSWRFDCTGCRFVRMNVSVFGSGTMVVQLNTLSIPGGISIQLANSLSGSQTISGTMIITATSATAFAAGPNGTTNPTLVVITNVSNEAGGLSVTGGADAVGVALAALGSNTNEPLKLDAKGAGTVSIGTVSTGGVISRIKVATKVVGGTSISNANAVDEGYYYVTGANDTAAVILPASVVGKQVTVKNTVANKILIVFPQILSQVNALGVNAAYNMAASTERTFTCVSTTLWYTDPETIA